MTELRVLSNDAGAPAFDAELIRKYDCAGPRYTSYPTAVQFHDDFTTEDYRRCVQATNEDLCPSPLSLYIHIPFCDTVCFYCACTKVITRNRRHAEDYLQRLYPEISLQAALYDDDREVRQLHWGGGTPTFLDQQQMQQLMQCLRRHFRFCADDEGEFSIEIDPRTVDADGVRHLRELGFNRLSCGVQDFDPEVQKAVNRIQSEDVTSEAITAARQSGFKSVSLDLIYGLPHQSVVSFADTLEKIIRLSPDRLSVFNYAHLPERFKTQRQIREEDLPSPEVKLEILRLTIELLTKADYVYIGMDHFAKPDDDLAVALREGSLYRNFQGYSTHTQCDLVGMGMSAISMVGNCYAQNARDLDDYQRRIDAGGLAIARGVELDDDDWMRRVVIGQLSCRGVVDIPVIEDVYQVGFFDYFAPELAELRAMEADGLLHLNAARLKLTPIGRLLMRNVCMVFDKYLRDKPKIGSFSRVI